MIYLYGYFGLGDNIYQYPFVRELSKREHVCITTPFPEIYSTLKNVSFYKTETRLKTQQRNLQRHDTTQWRPAPPAPTYKFDYHVGRRRGLTVLQSFERCVGTGISGFSMDIPEEWKSAARDKMSSCQKPVCLVKFPSIRDEWRNESRNPDMYYFRLALAKLRQKYCVIGLGDNTGGERFSEEPPEVDVKYYNGEIPWTTVIGMISLADMVLCYPSLFLPACLALKTPCFCIYGGSAGNRYLTDPRMDLSRYAYAEPSPMCNCFMLNHPCNKVIDLHTFNSSLDSIMKISEATHASKTVGV